MHAGNESHKWRIHPDFEAKGRCHQTSTTGVSMGPQKELMSSKIKKRCVYGTQHKSAVEETELRRRYD